MSYELRAKSYGILLVGAALAANLERKLISLKSTPRPSVAGCFFMPEASLYRHSELIHCKELNPWLLCL